MAEGGRLTKMGRRWVELRRIGHQRAKGTGASWRSAATPCRRSSGWHGCVDAADGRGSPRTRAPTPELCGGAGQLGDRPSVVRTEEEKEWARAVSRKKMGWGSAREPRVERGIGVGMAGSGTGKGAQPAGAGADR
jgi:hypothetical protein